LYSFDLWSGKQEKEERFWCISYNYDKDYCWIGDFYTQCFDNEMYLHECGDWNWQRFRFINMGNGGEVMIKLDDWSNRCWERDRRRVLLNDCDRDNTLQRWIAHNGTFAEGPFELTQRKFTQQSHDTSQIEEKTR